MPSFDYSDIINLPYPNFDWNFLLRHPRMSVEQRAKIFSPFAALRGHSDALANTAEQKLNIEKDELFEDSREELNELLMRIYKRINKGENPIIKVTFFIQDKILAKGIGSYKEIEGAVTKINLHEKFLQIVDVKIPIQNIRKILIP